MKKLIVANWKMYLSSSASKKIANNVAKKKVNAKVVLCPSFVDLCAVGDIIKKGNAALCAQDVAYVEKGAYTGEVGVDELREFGVDYIIIGHSERRQYFKETDEVINKKLKISLKNGFHAILCVGEPLKVRKAKKQKVFIKSQISGALKGIPRKLRKKLIVAYEPIWAVGKVKSDTPEDAVEMHDYIRSVLKEPKQIVLYGGSINGKNAKDFLVHKGISGLLIGRASTKLGEFLKILG